MDVTKEDLQGMLTGFRDDVAKTIEDKSKEQSDKASGEIAELHTKLADADSAIVKLQEEIKKNNSFGLPGLESEKQKWSWSRFYTGLAKDFRAQKGMGDNSDARKFWETEGSFEAAVLKDYNASDGSDGTFLVPPQIYQGDIIDTIYANTAIMQMPVMKLTGLKGDVPIPVDNGNLSAYHLSETEAPTKTSSSFKLEWLRPKKIGTYVRVSNRLLDQTNNAIESIVRQKMTLDTSVELSRGLTNGTGTDSEGLGILGSYAKMTGVSDIGANGRRFTIDDLASMKQSLAVANELRDTATNGTLLHPAVLWGMLREKTEMYNGQASRNGQPKFGKSLIDQTAIEKSLRLSIGATTQIPATDVVGSSSTCSKVITGDWSKFIYASFRDPIFRVSDVASDSTGRSALLNDEIFLVMFLEYDCNCVRPTAFSGRGGAMTTESEW